MPLSAAERAKRRRQKLKDEGKYEEYKKKHSIAAKKSRQKKKQLLDNMTQKKKNQFIKDEREKTRKRVHKHRSKKMAEQARALDSSIASSSSTLINRQALGRAKSRIRKVLPKDELKKQVALQQLLEECGTDFPQTSESTVLSKTRATRLDLEVVLKIEEFYQRDDISRQSPGLKDYITIRNDNGESEKKQTRYLYQSITETFALFVKEHGAIVGKTKYASLRPKHVYLSNKLPHNVCLCKYHENFSMAVNSLHSAIGSPKYNHGFIELFICNPAKPECWLKKCDSCKDLLKTKLLECELICNDLPNEVAWYTWKDVEKKLRKVQETGTIEDLIEHVTDMSSTFYEHAYVKRNQAESYEADRKALSSLNYDPDVCLLQVDYSENYTCIAQDEVQSFHWVQPQVTLFTASAWHSGKQHPIVIVSDNRHHDKNTATIFIDCILQKLPNNIKEVHLWSDGPASQFKNRFIVEAIKVLEKRNGVHIIWNYFATSHGKGPVDGIGGSLKRTVRLKVMTRKAVVFNAEQFANAAKESSVQVINLSPQEIEAVSKETDLDKIFSKAPTVTGISKCHIMYWQCGKLEKAQISQAFDKGVKEKPGYCPQIIHDTEMEKQDDINPLAE